MDREWLKGRLQAAGLTQAALAAAMNLSPPRLSELVAGRRRLSLHEAAAMAAALQVDLNEVWQHYGQQDTAEGGEAA